jgi:hypothetical protein
MQKEQWTAAATFLDVQRHAGDFDTAAHRRDTKRCIAIMGLPPIVVAPL